MNRQYIGARYVPKVFNNNGSNEWVSGIAYEALTIVTYLENSYTSVKPVPNNVGTPNVATEYWACTGNVQGIIGNLDDRMDAVESDILELQEETSGTHKRYVFITDSYGNYTNAQEKNFIELIKEYLNISTGDIYDIHRGGSGFTKTGDNKWLNMLIENDENIADHDTITDIYCLGGANDYVENQSSDTIKSAINEFALYCKTNYPIAKVHTGCIGMILSNDLSARNVCIDAYKSIIYHGGTYVCNCEYILQWQAVIRSQDSVHPTETGVNLLGYFLSRGILQGDICDVRYNQVCTGTSLVNGLTPTVNMKMVRCNGTLNVDGGAGNNYIRMTGSATISGSTDILKITNNMLFGGNQKSLDVKIFIDDDYSESVNGVLSISAVNTDGTSTLKLTLFDNTPRTISSALSIYGRNTYID